MYFVQKGLWRFGEMSSLWSGSVQKNKNKIPAKVLWYFLVIPKFKHMFRNSKRAKSLMWHSDERISDNILRYPADSPQWNMIDSKFLDFGCDARNLQLGLYPMEWTHTVTWAVHTVLGQLFWLFTIFLSSCTWSASLWCCHC